MKMEVMQVENVATSVATLRDKIAGMTKGNAVQVYGEINGVVAGIEGAVKRGIVKTYVAYVLAVARLEKIMPDKLTRGRINSILTDADTAAIAAKLPPSREHHRSRVAGEIETMQREHAKAVAMLEAVKVPVPSGAGLLTPEAASLAVPDARRGELLSEAVQAAMVAAADVDVAARKTDARGRPPSGKDQEGGKDKAVAPDWTKNEQYAREVRAVARKMLAVTPDDSMVAAALWYVCGRVAGREIVQAARKSLTE